MPVDKFTNMIACVNRAALQCQVSTLAPNNKLIRKTLVVLQRLGYIRGFSVVDTSRVRVTLKYTADEKCVFRGVFAISKPGNRVFIQYKNYSGHNFFLFTKKLGASRTAILTTPKGLLTLQEAASLGLGGELLLGIS